MVRFALLLALVSCSGKPPQSAKDFIEEYSAAFSSGNVDRIMSLEDSAPVTDKPDIPPDLKKSIKEYSAEKRRRELEQDIRRKGGAYKMWTSTRYQAERDHQDHIHVEVRVLGARSDVVLVRTAQGLKISPFPSLYAD